MKLEKNDKIGIFVPSSPVKEPFRSQGLKRIQELGYIPVEVDHILRKTDCDFLAKTPQENVADLQTLLDDPQIKAIWAARGGYGSNHMLQLMQHIKITHPKIIIGSSDVSYLLWYFINRQEQEQNHSHINHEPTLDILYGPMAYSSLPENRFDHENLMRILSGDYHGTLIPGKELTPQSINGKIKGKVTGGCLTNLVSLLGTPYFPRVEDKILLLEDIGERPYKLDRMFWQLSAAGIFSKIKAVLLGQYPNCFKDENEKRIFLERVKLILAPHKIPALYDCPLGHSDRIHTLPLNIHIQLTPNGIIL